MLMLIRIAVVALPAAALLRLAGSSGQVVKLPPAMATSPPQTDHPAYHRPRSNRARVSYGCKAGALVFGWPAKGGVYVHRASASHCNKMRQLGAVWWESENAWVKDELSVPPYYIPERFLATGWPAGGGVWVLSTTEDIAAEKGAGMLFNAYNMEERCKLIEQLGGTFYADPKDCPDLDLE
ncbi:hypothetical protein C8A03DRAFT_46965 [Achaetomium macrosporum]|uniref:Uncharacterized protein n=1 Tax=Achaetomium macrosporum TaxID=79813 RepID=A0AAN7C5E0_9PEZI|nr:hypothetical protein C8A03DRAFT_46965 [Achaetomium macrosporum]